MAILNSVKGDVAPSLAEMESYRLIVDRTVEV